MKFTRVERLILANQYEILSLLSKSDADYYAHKRNAVASGYELEYETLAEDIYEREFSEEQCTFVLDVMSMHEALQLAEKSDRTTFMGFDGNNEGSHMAYARHFCGSSLEPFKHLQFGGDKFNSHMPTLSRYRAMVAEWQASADKARLTAQDVDRITGAR
jgi:uncharacterized protein